MTENTTDNTELLASVADTTSTEPDAAGFDIADWLTPVNQKEHRKTVEVNLIRDFSLEQEIHEFNALERQIKNRQQTGVVDPDASVADASDQTSLQARREDLHARIRSASVTVTVRAMTQPEINKALGGLKPANDMYWPRVFAQSVEFPDGSKLPVEHWPEFRNTIGEGQFNQLVEAFNNASFRAPVTVNAPF